MGEDQDDRDGWRVWTENEATRRKPRSSQRGLLPPFLLTMKSSVPEGQVRCRSNVCLSVFSLTPPARGAHRPLEGGTPRQAHRRFRSNDGYFKTSKTRRYNVITRPFTKRESITTKTERDTRPSITHDPPQSSFLVPSTPWGI